MHEDNKKEFEESEDEDEEDIELKDDNESNGSLKDDFSIKLAIIEFISECPTASVTYFFI